MVWVVVKKAKALVPPVVAQAMPRHIHWERWSEKRQQWETFHIDFKKSVTAGVQNRLCDLPFAYLDTDRWIGDPYTPSGMCVAAYYLEKADV